MRMRKDGRGREREKGARGREGERVRGILLDILFFCFFSLSLFSVFRFIA